MIELALTLFFDAIVHVNQSQIKSVLAHKGRSHYVFAQDPHTFADAIGTRLPINSSCVEARTTHPKRFN